MILINGEEADHIPVTDRGLHYGDGLFETIEVINGKPAFLNEHLVRFCAGCIRLKIPAPDLNLLTDEIHNICQQAGQSHAVLKLIFSRGQGNRGYRQPSPIWPTRILSLQPFPVYPPEYSDAGIRVRFCDTRLGINPALAGIKHLNRLEQVMARSEWDDPDIQEGIMLDINNQVIEGTMTNLFFIKSDTIHTSPINLAGVEGVMRGLIIQLIADNNLELVENYYDKAALLAADELFVCNSIIGIWPIRQVEQNRFMPGRITKQLSHWLSQLKKQRFINA